MWALISNIAKLWTLIQGLFSAFNAFMYWLAEIEVKKKNKAIDEAVEEIKEANKIEDDDARIKAKAQAMCKLEKLSNPDADCEPSDSSGSRKL